MFFAIAHGTHGANVELEEMRWRGVGLRAQFLMNVGIKIAGEKMWPSFSRDWCITPKRCDILARARKCAFEPTVRLAKLILLSIVVKLIGERKMFLQTAIPIMASCHFAVESF